MLKPLEDVSSAELVRNFAEVSDRALREPLRVTSRGRGRLVLLSIDEYDRLKRRDRVVVRIEDLSAEEIDLILSAKPSPESEAFNHEVE
jgi:prevent-host-death family protein